MKLYFYFLDTRKNNCIRMEECEVEEKPKTYKAVTKFPKGYYGCFVRKDEIGRLTGFCQNAIILTEENIERVAKAFTCACLNDISRAQRIIEKNQKNIEESKNAIVAIEKWRSENAK